MTAATFQSTINVNLAFGVVGELIQDGPQRVDSLTLDSTGGAVGLAYTKSNSTGIASVGGTGVFAGILVNPKVYASRGVSGATLDPTMTLPGNSQGEFLTMGTIVVSVTNAANIGDWIEFNQTTGALKAISPGATADAGYTIISNCTVYRNPTSAAGLVAIRLTSAN
jgi:hypothetical protein